MKTKIHTSLEEALRELDNPLRHETTICWLFDPTLFPFVREGFDLSRSRTRPPKARLDSALVVGYAITKQSDVPTRRVWTIRRDDFRSGNVPSEAVDPATIEPQRPSRNDRAAKRPGAASRPAKNSMRPLRESGKRKTKRLNKRAPKSRDGSAGAGKIKINSLRALNEKKSH